MFLELKLPVERVTRQLSADHEAQVVFQFLSGVVELISRDKISIHSIEQQQSAEGKKWIHLLHNSLRRIYAYVPTLGRA